MELHRRGYSAFVLVYRVNVELHETEPQAKGGEASKDVLPAVRYLIGHQAEYGYTMDGFGMFGFSAGGLMTTAYAFSDYKDCCHKHNLPRPAAIFPIYGLHWELKVHEEDKGLAIFSRVGRDDPTGFAAVEKIIPDIRKALGQENVDIVMYDKLGHGFGLGIDTGKRDDIALREKEKEIQKDLDDGIDHIGKKMTVCQLYAKQIRHRANVRHGTKQGRKQLMRILQEDKLGACRIENVKLSDAKEWALRMKEKGYGFKTINNHKRSLKAAFYTAIQDDCIRKNPFDFQLNTVLEDDTEPKEPLSPTQEAAFLSFVQHDKVYQKYYDEIIILLGTGLRISELCGLTEADIDLDKQLINVDHQLLKIADVGYYVETPKTKSGNRVIPMSEKVLEAFQRVLNKRKYAQPV